MAQQECPACGEKRGLALLTSTDRLYGTTDREFTVIECSGCGLIRIDPIPEPFELETYYPKQYWFSGKGSSIVASLEEEYRRLVLSDHVHFADRAIRESEETGKILDVGCGGGLFLRMLNERGHDVMGLDFSQDAARVAWERRMPDSPLTPRSSVSSDT